MNARGEALGGFLENDCITQRAARVISRPEWCSIRYEVASYVLEHELSTVALLAGFFHGRQQIKCRILLPFKPHTHSNLHSWEPYAQYAHNIRHIRGKTSKTRVKDLTDLKVETYFANVNTDPKKNKQNYRKMSL